MSESRELLLWCEVLAAGSLWAVAVVNKMAQNLDLWTRRVSFTPHSWSQQMIELIHPKLSRVHKNLTKNNSLKYSLFNIISLKYDYSLFQYSNPLHSNPKSDITVVVNNRHIIG